MVATRARNAHEWYVTRDAEGPRWISEIGQRGHVFTYRGHCCRSGIPYKVPLKRYLLWQQHSFTNRTPLFGDPAIDTRCRGGFEIYDAPEPWGPWTTTYFTETWDVGPGEAACFPTKGISPDGCNLYLVFSGNEAFLIRGATLHLVHARK